MYKYKTITENVQRIAMEPPPFGAGFDKETALRGVRIEVWCSSFSDSGSDFTEFRLFDSKGNQIAIAKENGF
jgi:hypothetical protein